MDQGARIRAANALAANNQGLVRHARGLLLPECRLLAQRVMRLIFEPSSVRLYMRPAGSRMKPRTGLVRFSVSMAPPAPSVTTATDPLRRPSAIGAFEARERPLGHEHDDDGAGLHAELKTERA